jgi:replicative DNA helicase
MSPERVAERALAIEGRASVDELRTGTLADATRASLGVAALRLLERMPAVARLASGDGADGVAAAIDPNAVPDVLIVDSLQGLARGTRDLDEELATAVQRLKSIAIDQRVAVLATAHLPRFTRERPDPRPTLEDFGALGAVKHHADVVLALFREEMYNHERSNDGATELAVLKNRNGSTSYVDLYFYKQWLRFEDMVEPDR